MLIIGVLLNSTTVLSGAISTESLICWIIAFILAGLAIIGGILGLAWSKRGGGSLALVAGIIACGMGVVLWFVPWEVHEIFAIYHYSLIGTFLSVVTMGIPLEGVFIFVGGIAILASKKEAIEDSTTEKIPSRMSTEMSVGLAFIFSLVLGSFAFAAVINAVVANINPSQADFWSAYPIGLGLAFILAIVVAVYVYMRES